MTESGTNQARRVGVAEAEATRRGPSVHRPPPRDRLASPAESADRCSVDLEDIRAPVGWSWKAADHEREPVAAASRSQPTLGRRPGQAARAFDGRGSGAGNSEERIASTLECAQIDDARAKVGSPAAALSHAAAPAAARRRSRGDALVVEGVEDRGRQSGRIAVAGQRPRKSVILLRPPRYRRPARRGCLINPNSRVPDRGSWPARSSSTTIAGASRSAKIGGNSSRAVDHASKSTPRRHDRTGPWGQQ